MMRDINPTTLSAAATILLPNSSQGVWWVLDQQDKVLSMT